MLLAKNSKYFQKSSFFKKLLLYGNGIAFFLSKYWTKVGVPISITHFQTSYFFATFLLFSKHKLSFSQCMRWGISLSKRDIVVGVVPLMLWYHCFFDVAFFPAVSFSFSLSLYVWSVHTHTHTQHLSSLSNVHLPIFKFSQSKPKTARSTHWRTLEVQLFCVYLEVILSSFCQRCTNVVTHCFIYDCACVFLIIKVLRADVFTFTEKIYFRNVEVINELLLVLRTIQFL